MKDGARTRAGGRTGPRPEAWVAVACLLLAAAFWAAFLPRAERSVFGRVPVLDEVYYLDRGADWRDGRALDDAFYMSPLYPRLIAAVGAADAAVADGLPSPRDLRGLRLLQIGCWLGTVVLLRLLAGWVLGGLAPPGWRRRVVVWLPALLFALYRPAAIYAVSVLLDVPLAFLVTLVLALATRARIEPGSAGGPWRRFALPLGLGAAVGAAILLRGTAVFLLPLAAAAVAVGRPRRIGLPAAALVLVAAALVVAPAAVHNSRLAGRPVGPALNGGVNLYIGNGPEANGFYVAVVPGDWRFDPAGQGFLAERFRRDAVSLAEADRLWADAALQTMRERPWRTLGLWAKKMWLHLQGWEIDQLTPLARWTAAVPLLHALFVPYGLIALLALAGAAAVVAGRVAGPVRWWALALALLLAGQSLFFVVSRYRLALLPVLALLAGYAALQLLTPGRRLRTAVAAALALLVIVPWGLDGVRADWRGLATANEAMCWYEVGQQDGDPQALARAADLYGQALDAGASTPATWLGLSAVLMAQDDRTAATAVLEEGWRAVPDNRDIGKSLISLLVPSGRRVEALVACVDYLQRFPRDADVLHIASVLLDGMLRREAAMALAHRLLTAHPGDPRGYNDLGVLLAREGRTAEARAMFERGLQASPGNRDLATNLQRLDRDAENSP